MKLHGLVQIDGKYVGGVLRTANKKKKRKDGRKKENQSGKRMCVLALREANRHAPNCRAMLELEVGLSERLKMSRTIWRLFLPRRSSVTWLLAVPADVERGLRAADLANESAGRD